MQNVMWVKKEWTGRAPFHVEIHLNVAAFLSTKLECVQNQQSGTSSCIWRCFWQGKWHASYIMLKKNYTFEGKVWCCEQEIGGKLAHPPSFTLIVLALLSRRCRVTDRWVRADTCFWRSLIFKCSSCVNTNTWGNQLAVYMVWVACNAVLTHKPPCLVVSVAFLLSYCQIHCHVWISKNQPGRKNKQTLLLHIQKKRFKLWRQSVYFCLSFGYGWSQCY